MLESIDGADDVQTAVDLLEIQLAEPGKVVTAAGSNNEYLGHVMVGDAEGLGARDRVETLLSALCPKVVGR